MADAVYFASTVTCPIDAIHIIDPYTRQLTINNLTVDFSQAVVGGFSPSNLEIC